MACGKCTNGYIPARREESGSGQAGLKRCPYCTTVEQRRKDAQEYRDWNRQVEREERRER